MNDFADWFSPILVKELRQGMRSRAFMGTFLAIQVFMIVCVLVSLGNDSDNRNSVTALFWTVICIAVLLAMPLRGIATLNGEMKGNTLELMLLTQLSAWRITAGKWLALILQTLLLICAVLPYVVLRYFLGGVNIIDDLTILGWALVGSALFTAVTVGLSPFMKSAVMRIAVGIGLLFSLIVLPQIMFNARISGRGVAPALTTWLLVAALLGPLLVLEFFELGVGKIAPAAENHGARKRLIVIVLLAVAATLGRMLHESVFLHTLAALAAAPIILGALMEETLAIPSMYRPFVRKKQLGWVAGRVLYPGWATGLLFGVLVTAVFLWSAPLAWSNEGVRFRVVEGIEAVVVPLALVRLCFRRAKSILPFYFGLQLFLFVMAIILSANFNHDDPNLAPAGFIPTVGFFLHVFGNDTMSHTLPISVASITLGLWVLLLLSIKEWKMIGALERQAATLE